MKNLNVHTQANEFNDLYGLVLGSSGCIVKALSRSYVSEAAFGYTIIK